MDVFGALADPVRRSLLDELATGPSRVVDLAAQQPISRPAVSKHLRLLTEAGLVDAADHGRERHYALRAEALQPVLEFVAGLRSRPAGVPDLPDLPDLPDIAAALDALDTEVRRTERERRARTEKPTRKQAREETA